MSKNVLYKDRRAFEIEQEFELLKAKQEFNKNIIKEPLTGEKQAASYAASQNILKEGRKSLGDTKTNVETEVTRSMKR